MTKQAVISTFCDINPIQSLMCRVYYNEYYKTFLFDLKQIKKQHLLLKSRRNYSQCMQ
jgi:hypothetical protein